MPTLCSSQEFERMGHTVRPVTPLGIIAHKLAELCEAAPRSPALDAGFRQTLTEAAALATGLDGYVAAVTTPASPALHALAQATAAEDWSARFADGATGLALEQEMLSGHLEGQFLKLLVQATGARRILEIGLFTGYSALAMAEGLPADGTLVACEVDQFAADFARRAFAASPAGAKIRAEVAPAAATLARLADAGERFDFVFIDADKAGYAAYLDTLLGRDLLTPNALICVDNTLLQGEPWLAGTATANGRAIAEFNRSVAADARVEQVLLPIRDGLTLIRRVTPHG